MFSYGSIAVAVALSVAGQAAAADQAPGCLVAAINRFDSPNITSICRASVETAAAYITSECEKDSMDSASSALVSQCSAAGVTSIRLPSAVGVTSTAKSSGTTKPTATATSDNEDTMSDGSADSDSSNSTETSDGIAKATGDFNSTADSNADSNGTVEGGSSTVAAGPVFAGLAMAIGVVALAF